jgi:hypothetical protein
VSPEVLQVRFTSPEALRSEFEKNIANRGIFVACERPLEVRQPVVVQLLLDYADRDAPALCLDGEVVHVVPPELAASGATPGIAVQLDANAADLKARFSDFLGAAKREDAAARGSQPSDRRRAGRDAVRVPVRVMPATRPPFEATSRDLSATGILLSMREGALPIGEPVRVHLWHPQGEPTIELDGEVVRQIPNRQGRVVAVAVAFDRRQAAAPRAVEVIDALRQAGHRSRLGGISGTLADLGLANLLQMFGSSAPQGTLVVERAGEQGWVAFAHGQLLAAELGPLEGKDALVTMLAWGEGRFEFEASADRRLLEGAERQSLTAVVLDAVCALDESRRARSLEGDARAGSVVALGGHAGKVLAIGPEAVFRVDAEQEAVARSSLDKTSEAVLDLSRAGMNLARMLEVIPEPPEVVRAALDELVELGVLTPR